METPNTNLFLFVLRDRTQTEKSQINRKLLPMQTAIDYIIRYNPKVVVVDRSMQDGTLAEIQRSVAPWFSGSFIKRTPQEQIL